MNLYPVVRLSPIGILITLAATITFSAYGSPVDIAVVTVGDPANAPDVFGPNGNDFIFGAVGYVYRIGKYDVTAAQYATFLNAVARADPYGLYDPNMANGGSACITRSGVPGSYNYSVITGRENFPANWIRWGSAARFVNWLQNGQPTAPQGPGTTETGSYTLNGATTAAGFLGVKRNAGAIWFLPNDNEWFKSAYYKGGGVNAGYWTYPTQSDSKPSNVLSATGTNNANFYDNGFTNFPTGETPVGAFAASPGPYGTYDQGGNLFQWTETKVTDAQPPFNVAFGARGGSFDVNSTAMRYDYGIGANPDLEWNYGFRVAAVAEPSCIALLAFGTIGLIMLRCQKAPL